MFSLLRLLLIVVICLIGIGLWLGWITFTKPQPEGASGKVDIRMQVDENKIKSDLGKMERKLDQKAKQLQDRSGGK